MDHKHPSLVLKKPFLMVDSPNLNWWVCRISGCHQQYLFPNKKDSWVLRTETWGVNQGSPRSGLQISQNGWRVFSGCSNETPTPQKGVKTTEVFEKFPGVWWLKRPFSWQLSGRGGLIFFGGRWREWEKKGRTSKIQGFKSTPWVASEKSRICEFFWWKNSSRTWNPSLKFNILFTWKPGRSGKGDLGFGNHRGFRFHDQLSWGKRIKNSTRHHETKISAIVYVPKFLAKLYIICMKLCTTFQKHPRFHCESIVKILKTEAHPKRNQEKSEEWDSHPRKTLAISDPSHLFVFFFACHGCRWFMQQRRWTFWFGLFFVSPPKRQGFTRLGEEGWHGWHPLQTPPNVPWWEQKHPGSCRQLGAEISWIEHKPVCEAFARESGGFGEGRNLLKNRGCWEVLYRFQRCLRCQEAKMFFKQRLSNTTGNEYSILSQSRPRI